MIVRTIPKESGKFYRFRLLKNFMVEVEPSLGRPFYSTKKNLKRGLRTGDALYNILQSQDKLSEAIFLSDDPVLTSVEKTKEGLRIGCMRFDKENSKKIREWLRS